MSLATPITRCSLILCLACGCLGSTRHIEIRQAHVSEPWGKDALGSYAATTNLTDNALKDKIGERMVETYNEFDLSFVEFDDQGKLWDPIGQLTALDDLADDPQARTNGAFIVVFVHGWQENADVVNGTVMKFRQMLNVWNRDDDSGRRTIGVYVGWRGLSQQLPILKWFTFWSRKETAHKIGRGDMDELLVHLDALKAHIQDESKKAASTNSTRLIVIGHSFGGAIVFSALDNVLKKSTMASVLSAEQHPGSPVRRISAGSADLIVLLNPAFQTLLYSGLAHAAMGCTNFSPRQTTVLMTIGAQNDSATGTAFPIGQFFPSLVQNFKPGSDERIMNRKALGHYDQYFNCLLSAFKSNSTVSATSQNKHAQLDISVRSGAQKKQARKVFTSTIETNGICAMLAEAYPDRKWDLSQLPRKGDPPVNSPFLIITAKKNIVDNHTGIWNDSLMTFLQDFIYTHDLRTKQTEAATPPSHAE